MWRLFHKLFGWDYVLVMTSLENMACRLVDTASGPAAIVYRRPYIMKQDGTFDDAGGQNFRMRWKPLTRQILFPESLAPPSVPDVT